MVKKTKRNRHLFTLGLLCGLFILTKPLYILGVETENAAGIGTKASPYANITQKDPSATKEIVGNIVPYCLWIDPKKWELLKDNLNPIADHSFSLSNGDAFAMIL